MSISFWKLFTIASLAGTGACVSKLYFNHTQWEKYNIEQYHSNPLINPQYQNNLSKKQLVNYVDTYASSHITTHHYDPSSEYEECNTKEKVVEEEDAGEVQERVCEVKKKVCEVKKEVCELKKVICDVKKEVSEVKKEDCEVKKEVCEDAKVKVCEDTEVKVCEDTEVKVCEDTEVKVCEDTEVKVCEDTEVEVCEDTEVEVCEDTEVKVCEDTEVEVCEDTEVEVCEDTEVKVCKDTEEKVCKDTDAKVCKDTEAKVCKDTEAKVCEDTKAKVCEDTEVKVCKDTEVKVCKDTEVKVCEDTEAKVCKDTEVKVCKDTEAKVCKDTEEKVCEDTNVKVCEEKRDVCEEKKDVCDQEESEEDDDGEFDDDERPACNTLTIDCQIKVYSDLSCPTRTIITHKNDWVVYCDSRTRTPFWIVEVIGKCDLVKAKHRHCEAFRVAFKQAEDFRFGNPKNVQRLDVELVHAPKRRKTPKEKCSYEIQEEESPDKKYSCDYCKYSAFWPVFHEYIGFLLSCYEYIHVCSGFLYLPEKEPEKNEIYEGLPEVKLTPSHFFKVILAKNKDSTYRFECYKIPYERIKDKCVELRKYLTTRDDLEREAGFAIFSDIPICYMKQASTHPCFPPSATQSFFPENAYTGGKTN